MEEAEYEKAKDEMIQADKQSRLAFGSYWSPATSEEGSRRSSMMSGSLSSSKNPDVFQSLTSGEVEYLIVR